MEEKTGVGVGHERTLEERLREYPELRARFEAMLAIVENADGDVVKVDEAEEQVIVGVGMRIAAHPLRRSGRALLTHPAPVSGDDD